MNKAVFPALTGVRAVAAAMVVIHYLIEVENKLLQSIIRELNIGVSIFFVLSGFLITYRYFDSFSFSKDWWRIYLRNRFARIYPLFFFLTTASFILGNFVTNLSPSLNLIEYILNIPLFKGFLPSYAYTGIAQSWTLTVEECFYILAPFIFFFIHKKVNVYIQCFFLFLLGLISYSLSSGINFSNGLEFVFVSTIFGRIFEFATGIILGIHLSKNSKRYLIKASRSSSGFFNITSVSLLLFIGILLFLTTLQTHEIHYSIQTIYGYLISAIILPFVIAAFFIGLILENTVISKILSTRLFVYLGKSSYALYLFHWGIFGYMINQIVQYNIILNILITYLISFALFSFIEEPLNHLIKRKLASKALMKEANFDVKVLI